MTRTAEQLREELDRLPEQDRAALAEHLLRSLDDAADTAADDAFFAELQRRDARRVSGEDPGVPLEDLTRRIREKRP
ncbi:MAG: addiction module protein [Phycisphaeraceae bacterium]